MQEKTKITTLEKLQKTAEKLNNNEKIKFDFTQQLYYLAYDFNTKFITQLITHNAFKVQGVVYCLSASFKEKAIQWIGKKELENYLKDY